MLNRLLNSSSGETNGVSTDWDVVPRTGDGNELVSLIIRRTRFSTVVRFSMAMRSRKQRA